LRFTISYFRIDVDTLVWIPKRNLILIFSLLLYTVFTDDLFEYYA